METSLMMHNAPVQRLSLQRLPFQRLLGQMSLCIAIALPFATTGAMASSTTIDSPTPPSTQASPTHRQGHAAPTDYANWKKPPPNVLKQKLSPLQYAVTQQEDTEPPFKNAYWDNKKAGLYVDIVSGEPLFASVHKYPSGTGWPSFWQPLEADNIVYHKDRTLWMTRTEVKSRFGDSHLGHVFDDGPDPTGKRYCINSAALRFVPVAEMAAAGYGQYLHLFNKSEGSKSKHPQTDP